MCYNVYHKLAKLVMQLPSHSVSVSEKLDEDRFACIFHAPIIEDSNSILDINHFLILFLIFQKKNEIKWFMRWIVTEIINFNFNFFDTWIDENYLDTFWLKLKILLSFYNLFRFKYKFWYKNDNFNITKSIILHI